MARGIRRLSKKVTRSSMSFKDDPPVDTMTGFFVFAIFSIRIQSLQSELAIFKIGIPNSQHRSTELSSKGVAMGMQLAARIAFTSWEKSSASSLVSIVFLI